jgi:hypothetical protein
MMTAMNVDFRTYDNDDRPVTMTLLANDGRASVLFCGRTRATGAIITKTDGSLAIEWDDYEDGICMDDAEMTLNGREADTSAMPSRYRHDGSGRLK